jgi:CDP-6-deoxy-D-xylo-4-hexulose-3-dehydrase
MIEFDKIESLVGNHVAPYIYNSKNFIPNKTPIYYSGPFWDKKEITAAINSFLNGKWISSGEKVYKFEIEFGKKFNVKFCVMVNSGSSANLILMTALKLRYGWNDGDEIIVSPVGFPTTISVIHQNNLKPIFIDIELDTLNFDVNKIEEKITEKTKAIFVSPVLGNPPDMDKLISICEKHNLKLIGDNCDSLGSKWDGKYLNEYYVAFSNSFYPAHHISTGEGGMVCTNDEELKKLMLSLTWWGRDCYCVGSANLLSCGTCQLRFNNWLKNYDGTIDHKYVFTTMGYNLKPLDLQGAIGLEQLKKIDLIEEKRKNSKDTIEKLFISKIKGVKGVTKLEKSDVSWFGTPFICESKELKNRLVKFLEDNKIQTRNYFAGNILLHPGYSFLDDYSNYPNSNEVLDKVFFVGAAPHYTQEVFNYIESVLDKFEN